jgi:hypothetical protein
VDKLVGSSQMERLSYVIAPSEYIFGFLMLDWSRVRVAMVGVETYVD